MQSGQAGRKIESVVQCLKEIEMSDLDKLREAIAWAEKYHPLPRCKHGNCLMDGGGEHLVPPCGCRYSCRTGRPSSQPEWIKVSE